MDFVTTTTQTIQLSWIQNIPSGVYVLFGVFLTSAVQLLNSYFSIKNNAKTKEIEHKYAVAIYLLDQKIAAFTEFNRNVSKLHDLSSLRHETNGKKIFNSLFESLYAIEIHLPSEHLSLIEKIKSGLIALANDSLDGDGSLERKDLDDLIKNLKKIMSEQIDK